MANTSLSIPSHALKFVRMLAKEKKFTQSELFTYLIWKEMFKSQPPETAEISASLQAVEVLELTDDINMARRTYREKWLNRTDASLEDFFNVPEANVSKHLEKILEKKDNAADIALAQKEESERVAFIEAEIAKNIQNQNTDSVPEQNKTQNNFQNTEQNTNQNITSAGFGMDVPVETDDDNLL